MEFRLNKMISESGFCSRREADKFIEEGRVTVNGNLPTPGQKVSEHDIVLLDDLQIKISKSMIREAKDTKVRKTYKDYTAETTHSNTKKNEQKPKQKPVAHKASKSESAEGAEAGKSKGLRPGKYVKYNKYAAARHAEKNKNEKGGKAKEITFEENIVKEALRPKFGKSLSRSAVAQRLAASSKSASLRKTSKNNPVNKAKRALRNNPNAQDE